MPTDLLSLVFIGCFAFGLLFFIVTALLGNLGHGNAGTHAADQHGLVHVGGHATGAHGVGHAATHGPLHAHGPAHTTGHAASAQGTTANSLQGTLQSVLGYINITSVMLFLLGFGFFGYVLHNTTPFVLPLLLVLAGVSGLVIAILMLLLLSRLFGDSEGATVQDVSDRTGMVGKVSRPGVSREILLGLFDGRNRRQVAVVVTTDGRRVQMPLHETGLHDGSLLGFLRSLLVGLDGLLGLLITGSRRENGGTRRNGR